MIKLCIFDLDGTVMDTLSSIAYFVNITLEKMGFEKVEDEEHFKYFAGDGRRELLTRSLKHINKYSEETLEKMIKIYDEAYEGNSMHLTKPFDGMKEAISRIKEGGIKVAILSNKPDVVTRRIVAEEFGENFFDYVRGQLDHVPMKPDPSGFLSIAENLGVSPEECLMIGDTNVDIFTGINAKAHTLGVLWGFRTYDELKEAGAEHIVSDTEEMAEYILS